jgi:hypothetical protein
MSCVSPVCINSISSYSFLREVCETRRSERNLDKKQVANVIDVPGRVGLALLLFVLSYSFEEYNDPINAKPYYLCLIFITLMNVCSQTSFRFIY